MSKKLALVLVLAGLVGACAQQSAPQAPVTQEPVFTGKYGK